MLQRRVDSRQVASGGVESGNAGLAESELVRARLERALGLRRIFLADLGERGQQNDAVPNEWLENVILNDRFACFLELRRPGRLGLNLRPSCRRRNNPRKYAVKSWINSTNPFLQRRMSGPQTEPALAQRVSEKQMARFVRVWRGRNRG